LRIGALLPGIEHAEHGIPDLEVAHAFSSRADDAREIAPERKWKLCRLVLAEPHLPISGIYARCNDVDHDLAGSCLGIGQIAVFEHFRAAVLFDECSLHWFCLCGLPPTLPSPACGGGLGWGGVNMLRAMRQAGALDRWFIPWARLPPEQSG